MKKLMKEQKTINEGSIMRRLEKSRFNSPKEYEMIIISLKQQGQQLLSQREQLKIRVQLLKQKQKQLLEEQSVKTKKNYGVDYNRLKKQLQQKYQEFENWQKRCYSSINKGALNIQVKEYMNQCAVVEGQIVKYKTILDDQKRENKKLQKSVRTELKYMNKNIPEKQVLQEQNKELRRMIWNMRINQDLTSHVEVRLHNSIVGLQKKRKFIEKLKTMTIQEIRREEGKNKIEIIKEQMKEKKIRQNSLVRVKTESRLSSNHTNTMSRTSKTAEEIQKEEKILKQTEDIKKVLQNNQIQQKSLQQQKVILHQQLTKLIQQFNRQQQEIIRRKQKKIVQVTDVSLQFNQFEDQDQLPREIIGNETLLLQDDRVILKTSKDTLIKGIVAYENQIGIACLRALYSNGKQTLCLPPEDYLEKKCKHKKMMVQDPKDYIKYMKVYFDRGQRKLVRIEIYSNNKVYFQMGKEKQNFLKTVVSYKFDYNYYELPVCFRLSYQIIQKQWVVTSFGVQINSK